MIKNLTMQRYILTLAYKGTNFHGWQMQPNAKTVQGAIKEALTTILRQKICIYGAGRTDTGVHASFYVAHFDAIKQISDLNKFKRSLNGILPDNIAVYEVFPVENDFNSRFSAVSRTYHYIISRTKNPFIKEFSHFYPYNLDVKKMNKAAEILKEYDDFKSFEKAHSGSKTSICKITDAKWLNNNNVLIFRITADRFLRNMVRSIVGTMIDIGRGKVSIEQFRQIIESKKRSNAGASADAKGLFLTDIIYPQQIENQLITAKNESKFFYDFIKNDKIN